MKCGAIVFGALLLCGTTHAASSSPQRYTIPSGPSAIPADVANKMDRQEQRLEDIDKRLALMEKVVGKLDSNVEELVRTNIIINFVMGSMKLLVPGLLIAGFGIWFKHYLDHRPPPKPAI